MAFEKIAGLTNLIASLPDRMNENAKYLKEYFDASPKQLMEAFNKLCDKLGSSAAGASGAENIGSAPINGITGTTVHEQIKSVASVAASERGSVTLEMLEQSLRSLMLNVPIFCSAQAPLSDLYMLTLPIEVTPSDATPARVYFFAPAAAVANQSVQIKGTSTVYRIADRDGKLISPGAWRMGNVVELILVGWNVAFYR